MRRILAAQLRLWNRDGVADAALLCLTELLGNVIAHCPLDPWVTVRTSPTERGVRIEVFDGVPQLPVPQPAGEARPTLASNGRGLTLISAYADAFGFDPVVGGKCAWVEIGP